MTDKQQLLGALIKHGFVHLRCQFYATTTERLLSCFSIPNRWQYNRDLANLLHRLGETVDTPDFTDTDISFLNHAVPVFLGSKRNQWDLRLLDLLVKLHDSVPSEHTDKITWHPAESMRLQLAEWTTRNEQTSIQYAQLLRDP